ncbi:MAG: hypothetical protein LBF59_06845 [Prevotellaceae bacterium]|nr:hypothetical protein [Prevotellaceae bacterium]
MRLLDDVFDDVFNDVIIYVETQNIASLQIDTLNDHSIVQCRDAETQYFASLQIVALVVRLRLKAL